MPLQIIRQDITKIEVDAIVNTTNEEMVGYSGVDLAIHEAAGKALDEECRKLAPLPLGEVRVTGGYALPCEHVIHVRGPVWEGGVLGEEELLKSAYLLSLGKAAEYKCRSVALPLISTGEYGYPKERALPLALETVSAFLLEHEMTVYLCVFDEDSTRLSQKLFGEIENFLDDHLEEGFAFLRRPSSRRREGSAPFQSEWSMSCCEEMPSPLPQKDLQGHLCELDQGFKDMLFALIDESGMTDVECYKRANVDKRTFSKIKSNRDYRPSKQTALAFAIALRLDVKKTQALLATVGMTLSKSIKFDVIVLYFMENGIYDIFKINEALFHYDQLLLGSI